MNSLSVDQPISGLEVLVQKEAFRFCSLWQKAIRILSNFNEFSLKFPQAFKLNFNSKPSLHFIVFEPSNGDSIEFEIIDSKLWQLIICVVYWLQTPIDWVEQKKSYRYFVGRLFKLVEVVQWTPTGFNPSKNSSRFSVPLKFHPSLQRYQASTGCLYWHQVVVYRSFVRADCLRSLLLLRARSEAKIF